MARIKSLPRLFRSLAYAAIDLIFYTIPDLNVPADLRNAHLRKSVKIVRAGLAEGIVSDSEAVRVLEAYLRKARQFLGKGEL